jgi:hypothetical protein
MSENQPLKNLLQRLASVDSKLEELLTSQSINKREGLAGILHEPDAGGSQEIGPDPWKDADIPEARHAAALPPNSCRFSSAISPIEADAILQKVQKINSDAELMERVIKLEKQNRRITILGSMFMTLVVLILTVFTVLMVQANVFHRGVILQAWQKVDSPKPSSEKERPQVKKPQAAEPIAQVKDPQAAGPVAPPSAPDRDKSMAPTTNPETAKAPAPVTYVGSSTSNKYHYPDCKWAAKIKPYKLRTFHSVKEAQEKGYIPCPHCMPPGSD